MIIAAVIQKLDPVIKHMDKLANLAEAAISDTGLAVDWLYRTGEEMRDKLQQGMETAKEDIQKITESLHNNISKLMEAAVRSTSGNAREATHHQEEGLTYTTYAEALNNQLPALHLSTLTRSRFKERQVSIDTDPSTEPNHIRELTE